MPTLLGSKSTRLTSSATPLLVALLCFVAFVGCSDAPSRIPAAEWDPEPMADQAMIDLDKDTDGLLSAEELEAAPGLKYASQAIDAEGDGDGNLSRDEIRDRIAHYKKMRTGLTSFSCSVVLGRKPLVGAKVRLVPEPFLGEVVQTLESTSAEGGQAEFFAEGINMSVAPICMYRVEVTMPDGSIPARYNTQTTLGVEISAITDPFHSGPVVFRLDKK